MRKYLGWIAAITAILLTVYLFLGIFLIVPLTEHFIFGESLLRFFASCAVLNYLIAAWAFWKI
jgi:hypothetical protein